MGMLSSVWRLGLKTAGCLVERMFSWLNFFFLGLDVRNWVHWPSYARRLCS